MRILPFGSGRMFAFGRRWPSGAQGYTLLHKKNAVFSIYYVQSSYFKIFEIIHGLFVVSKDEKRFLGDSIKDLPYVLL